MHYVDVLVCIYVYKYILKLTISGRLLYFGDGVEVYSTLPTYSNRIEISIMPHRLCSTNNVLSVGHF